MIDEGPVAVRNLCLLKTKFNSQKRRFLKAYIETASISRAANAAKTDRGRHYHWLREDADYKKAFEKSQDIAIQGLEDEAVRRAYKGVDEPVYQQGAKVGTIRRYVDTLLIFLLKGARPGKYRDENLWGEQRSYSGSSDC